MINLNELLETGNEEEVIAAVRELFAQKAAKEAEAAKQTYLVELKACAEGALADLALAYLPEVEEDEKLLAELSDVTEEVVADFTRRLEMLANIKYKLENMLGKTEAAPIKVRRISGEDADKIIAHFLEGLV